MRLSLRTLQLGAIAAVLAVSTYHAFELDRFFVAKELVLHVAAVLAALFAWRGLRQLETTRGDWLLLGYLGLSVLSALFATNRWLAFRALAVSVSSVLIFWAARTHPARAARRAWRWRSSPRRCRRSCRPTASTSSSSPRTACPAGPSATATSSPTSRRSASRCCSSSRSQPSAGERSSGTPSERRSSPHRW